jgi:hypothetical protein
MLLTNPINHIPTTCALTSRSTLLPVVHIEQLIAQLIELQAVKLQGCRNIIYSIAYFENQNLSEK